MDTTLTTTNTLDIERLKQYLKDVYTVEKELYCSQRAVQELERKIQEVKQPPTYPAFRTFDKTPGFLTWIPFITALMALFWCVEKEVGLVWGIVLVLASFVVGFFIQMAIDNQFTKEATARRNVEVDKIKAKYLEKISTLVPSYEATQQAYNQSIASCEETLENLYSKDIIFSKYRNLVAVSQFYEYFISGRCTTLEGHEGAYNLYEIEARQNIIITKLDRAINLLEEIRDTQYQLLEAIAASNALLRDIANNTAAIAYSNAAIAYNTAAIARNSMW